MNNKKSHSKRVEAGKTTNYWAILEYHYKGNTTTQVARICECSRTTVLKTIKRAKECGLTQSSVVGMNDFKLLCKLYPNRVQRAEYTYPDFEAIIKDKKKRKLTKYVAWRRYYKRTIAAGQKPYGKSQFFKMFKMYRTNSKFHFQSTETMKKAYSFAWEASYLAKGKRMLTMREAWEKLVLWCKKMRLDPQKI